MATAHINRYVRDKGPRADKLPNFSFDGMASDIPPAFNASSMIDRAIGNGHGDRTAIVSKERTLTYRQLLASVERCAAVLFHRHALTPGDTVLINSPNTVMSTVAWWAVLRAGGVAVSVMPLLRAHEIAKITDKARVSLAIVGTGLADAVNEARELSGNTFQIVEINGPEGLERQMSEIGDCVFAPVRTAADDPAIIAFTSGTTGVPKGCIQYHRDIAIVCDTFLHPVLRPSAGDVFCCTAPMAFTFGLGASVIFPVACGASVAIPDEPGYEGLAHAIETYSVSTLFTAPTAYRVLSRMPVQRFASLKTCVSAGESLSLETFNLWEAATGLRLIDGIGSTELMHIFISAPPEGIRPGATGLALPGYEACILDQDMRPVPCGEIGRLAVRGPTGCRYLDDDRQTTYVVDGWNLTGDLFRQDEDGYFWFVSRADDLIVTSGYNISAIEVEEAVQKHESVLEVAVVGVQDPERGQVCKAYIVPAPGAVPSHELAAAIQEFTKRTIAPYKYPRAVEFVASLPKTHTGKLKRSALKDGSGGDNPEQLSTEPVR
jgi:2-aminobenzoate-CoA ligase